MASRRITDEPSAFNQSSDSSGPFQKLSHPEFLDSIDKEHYSYLRRSYSLVKLALQCDFGYFSREDLRSYFIVLDEQIFGALRAYEEIREERAAEKLARGEKS